ncbi:DUF3892 domain-containing protein [Paenibacillus typhae]|uniref:DUF3892 domain-containing protein n=1 Tax=Paenibacillus typhae TaxID=1174501 RepID=UPI001C8ECFD6|nr:DUF3892 domain-containing protein [Paenibacillus typhae]MBY0011487.1 DUF3892 domain-containing protein [Paenibacillus typhae]
MARQVVAVRVAEPGTMEQHITDFELSNGTRFSKIQMIVYITIEPDAFYTNAAGKQAKLMIATTNEGERYVKTVGDSTRENNLLSLRRF